MKKLLTLLTIGAGVALVGCGAGSSSITIHTPPTASLNVAERQNVSIVTPLLLKFDQPVLNVTSETISLYENCNENDEKAVPIYEIVSFGTVFFGILTDKFLHYNTNYCIELSSQIVNIYNQNLTPVSIPFTTESQPESAIVN